MKLKEKFILYSNINKTPQKQKKPQNIFNSIFERIPVNIIKETPAIRQASNCNKKQFMNIITKDKKPKPLKIDNKMNDSEKKSISKINNFEKMIYEYNKERNEQMNNYNERKKENVSFSKNYIKLKKERNKFSTGTYLDYKSFLDISSKYISKNMKIPDLSEEHNLFSNNPLILSGVNLENYIVYNQGEKDKSIKYIKKLEKLINRKKVGKGRLSVKELDELNNKLKEEKSKGYIPPEIEIKQLKNDIDKTENSFNNLENFENFFKKLKHDKNIVNYNPLNKAKNKSAENIFTNQNINSNNSYDNSGILNARKLSVNFNLKNFTLNNTSITATTSIGVTRKPSEIENSKDNNNNHNISCELIQENQSKKIKLPRIVTPLTKISKIPINLKEKSIDDCKTNLNFLYKTRGISPINYKVYSPPKNNINNLLNAQLNKLKEKNKILKLRKISDSMNEITKKNLSTLTVDSEYDDLFELNNQIEKKNIIKPYEEFNNNYLDNNILENEINNNVINNEENKNNKTEKKIKKISFKSDIKNNSNDINNNDNQKENEKISEENNYDKIEKIFNFVKNNDNSEENKKEFQSYILSKNKSFNEQFDKKSVYKNIYKMKQKVENDFILEEYMIRNRFNIKIPFSKEQKYILNKNNEYTSKIIDHENKLKEILCKGKVEL